MHEASVAREILEIALKAAADHEASPILVVRVRVGAFAHLDGGSLRFAFDALKEGTAAGDAVLEVEQALLAGTCGGCGAPFEAGSPGTPCPDCGGREIRWEGESHTRVLSIDVDE